MRLFGIEFGKYISVKVQDGQLTRCRDNDPDGVRLRVHGRASRLFRDTTNVTLRGGEVLEGVSCRSFQRLRASKDNRSLESLVHTSGHTDAGLPEFDLTTAFGGGVDSYGQRLASAAYLALDALGEDYQAGATFRLDDHEYFVRPSRKYADKLNITSLTPESITPFADGASASAYGVKKEGSQKTHCLLIPKNTDPQSAARTLRVANYIRGICGGSRAAEEQYRIAASAWAIRGPGGGVASTLQPRYLVDGRTLLESPGLKRKHRVELVNQLFTASGELEAIGVVDRDNRPENLFFKLKTHDDGRIEPMILRGDFEKALIPGDSHEKAREPGHASPGYCCLQDIQAAGEMAATTPIDEVMALRRKEMVYSDTLCHAEVLLEDFVVNGGGAPTDHRARIRELAIKQYGQKTGELLGDLLCSGLHPNHPERATAAQILEAWRQISANVMLLAASGDETDDDDDDNLLIQ